MACMHTVCVWMHYYWLYCRKLDMPAWHCGMVLFLWAVWISHDLDGWHEWEGGLILAKLQYMCDLVGFMQLMR